MSLEKFITRIQEEFQDVVKGTINPDTNYREIIPWNSMNALLLMALIQVEYNIELKVEDLNSDISFREMYQKFIQPVE
ncbi:MAG: Acyl carrier protein [Bacteroidota bacterium]|nr:Acyl carrier protein [Bacteroidota bacterium]